MRLRAAGAFFRREGTVSREKAADGGRLMSSRSTGCDRRANGSSLSLKPPVCGKGASPWERALSPSTRSFHSSSSICACVFSPLPRVGGQFRGAIDWIWAAQHGVLAAGRGRAPDFEGFFEGVHSGLVSGSEFCLYVLERIIHAPEHAGHLNPTIPPPPSQNRAQKRFFPTQIPLKMLQGTVLTGIGAELDPFSTI